MNDTFNSNPFNSPQNPSQSSQHSNSQPSNSYVDAYAPPVNSSHSNNGPSAVPAQTSTQTSQAEPAFSWQTRTSPASASTATGFTPASSAPTPPLSSAAPNIPSWNSTAATPPAQPSTTYPSQSTYTSPNPSNSFNTPVSTYAPSSTPMAGNSMQNNAMPSSSYTNSSTPSSGAQASTVAPAVDSASAKPTVSQTLEDQNIFYLLGVQDGTDQEKEAFLDELQQVIWEDFLDRDVELLITEEEMVDLKKIMARKDQPALDQQEQIIVFLEKLIPDLEEIMLEKALELKEDMVRERIAGMREYYAGKDTQLGQLDKAEELINDDQWRAAAEVLNAISS